jgi:hypothetical protein
MGRTVTEELGGVQTVATVLDLARAALTPAPEQAEAAALLRLAWTIREETIGSVA